MLTNQQATERNELPVDSDTDNGHVTVMEQRHGTHLWWIMDGPNNEEVVVTFDHAYYDDRKLVLTQDTPDRREIKVFQMEYSGQFGAVSDWVTMHGTSEIPRGFK